ncbi:hypothetical protein AO370_0852 [Moraxella catarrhalis]|uniref:Uncharacterized protein n=1 Tax=Moraxella catarrhalis TaxID=480 RepID=A0AB36DPG8_MORCA|nr:hypothetical protein AO370_0852 [Moraxella catarrhalis]
MIYDKAFDILKLIKRLGKLANSGENDVSACITRNRPKR